MNHRRHPSATLGRLEKARILVPARHTLRRSVASGEIVNDVHLGLWRQPTPGDVDEGPSDLGHRRTDSWPICPNKVVRGHQKVLAQDLRSHLRGGARFLIELALVGKDLEGR